MYIDLNISANIPLGMGWLGHQICHEDYDHQKCFFPVVYCLTCSQYLQIVNKVEREKGCKGPLKFKGNECNRKKSVLSITIILYSLNYNLKYIPKLYSFSESFIKNLRYKFLRIKQKLNTRISPLCIAAIMFRCFFSFSKSYMCD